ncbi:MAG: peptidoglycan-binding domain-containing protein, partial [Pseudomonadota bacterium]
VFNDIKSVPHLFALPDSDPEVFDQRTAIAASANGNLLVALDVDFGELLALSVRRDRSRTRAPKITKSELREALGEVTLSTNLLIVSRTQLPEPADTLALSSNGEVLLMASRNHSTLTIIRNFGEWIQASETAKREVVAVIDSPSDETGSEQVTPYQNTAESALATDEVTFSALVQSFDGERSPTRGSPSVWVDQKALDILSYPVGEVDGLIGPQTRDAVRLFSTAAGITVVEYPSPEISGELRRSVKEKHAERMILRALDQDRIYKGDDDLRDTFESLEGHCERLPVDELCISQRSRGAGGSLDRGRSFLVEERFCEGSKPRRVQIDTYVFLGSRGDYFCSRDVSCATIQFDVPDGFRTVCLPNG